MEDKSAVGVSRGARGIHRNYIIEGRPGKWQPRHPRLRNLHSEPPMSCSSRLLDGGRRKIRGHDLHSIGDF